MNFPSLSTQFFNSGNCHPPYLHNLQLPFAGTSYLTSTPSNYTSSSPSLATLHDLSPDSWDPDSDLDPDLSLDPSIPSSQQYPTHHPTLPLSLLQSQKRILSRALHPDKHHHTPAFHRKNVRDALLLVVNAYDNLVDLKYVDWLHGICRQGRSQVDPEWDYHATLIDYSKAGREGTGRGRNVCDVRAGDLVTWGEWMVEVGGVGSGGWLGKLGRWFSAGDKDMGNKNAMNWGWGWVYDDDEEKTTPTPKLIWGGPPTTKLTFATEDECRKIEVIIPKHLYQKKQDIWQELWERIKWEVKTEIEEWKAIGWRRTGWKSWGKVSEEIKRVGIFAILGGLAWYGGRYVVAMVREVCGWLWILFGLILLRLGLRSRSGMPVTPVRATADRDTDTEILHPQLEEETDSDMHSMQLTPVRVIVDRNTDTETLHPRLEEEMDSDKHSMQMTLTQVTADRDRDLDKARDWYRGVETESLYPRLDEETDLDMHSMQMTLAQGTADRDSGTDTETLHPRLEEETETDDLSSTGFETGSC